MALEYTDIRPAIVALDAIASATDSLAQAVREIPTDEAWKPSRFDYYFRESLRICNWSSTPSDEDITRAVHLAQRLMVESIDRG